MITMYNVLSSMQGTAGLFLQALKVEIYQDLLKQFYSS